MGIQSSIENLVLGLFVGCVMAATALLGDVSSEKAEYEVRQAKAEQRELQVQFTHLAVEIDSWDKPEAPVQSAIGRVRTTASMLNRRTCASLSCTSVGQSAYGAELEYYAVEGDWVRVSEPSASQEIWVSRRYVIAITETGNTTKFAKAVSARTDGA